MYYVKATWKDGSVTVRLRRNKSAAATCAAELRVQGAVTTVSDYARADTMAGQFFSWAELTDSGTAQRLGLDNTPPDTATAALLALVDNTLDPLRRGLGRPVEVIDAYRAPAVNAALKGAASTSQHMRGEAADIRTRGLDATALAREVLILAVPFDQLIGYAPERGGHIHISYTTARTNRRDVLWAPAEGGYRPWRPLTP